MINLSTVTACTLLDECWMLQCPKPFTGVTMTFITIHTTNEKKVTQQNISHSNLIRSCSVVINCFIKFWCILTSLKKLWNVFSRLEDNHHMTELFHFVNFFKLIKLFLMRWWFFYCLYWIESLKKTHNMCTLFVLRNQ